MSIPQPLPDCDLLLTADLALTQDSGRRVLEKAAVAVRDGRIAALGSPDELAHLRPRERLDLGRALIMPGLINAHTHCPMTFFRGLADDMPLEEWLTRYIFPNEQRLTAEITEIGALIGCAEMTRFGCTAFADMYLFEDSVAAAADKSGLRVLLGEAIFSFATPASPGYEATHEKVRAQVLRYKDHSRLRVAVAMHSVYATGADALRASVGLAAELGLPLHIHLSETGREVRDCLEANGLRPLAYCRELGLVGPSTTFAHCVMLDEEELDELAASGAKVAHNPCSNMKLASGVAPVPAMLRRGILPGLGTDGAASNNSLNLFMEMRACALLHKVHSQDPMVCTAQEVLDMATLGGAAALGWPELGKLVPGGPADLIALDLTSPNHLPVHNPASLPAYSACGQEVRLCMVEGRILYKDGAYLALDYPSLIGEADKLARWARAKL
ncbi:MAG: amidohydrolase [Desulfovibrio sp.]|jgi:5-methylthioadenosine/S-adenosylhomocysteine deaminase|nr:amidohydrolase [Desulfovibrio sp.]